MLLVIDYSDLNFDESVTDIRIYEGNDFNVETFLASLCDGIEELCHRDIIDKEHLCLLDPDRRKISPRQKINKMDLNDWDTLYISRS